MTPLKPPCLWNEKYHRDFNHKTFFCRISAVSLTPLKQFQRCEVSMTPQKQLWGSGLKSFSGVNDTYEIRMTPLKPKNNFESPYFILKRTSSKTVSWVNIPIRCNYFKQKKVTDLTSFLVSAVSLTPLKPILATFEPIISANTKPYA
jgi:hypothetical protein